MAESMDSILLLFVWIAAQKDGGSHCKWKYEIQDNHNKRHSLHSAIVFGLLEVWIYQWSHWKCAVLDHNLLRVLLLRLSLDVVLLMLSWLHYFNYN
jgi:hypothetical protein